MRRALVTGGNRGIGRAIAAGLRDAGLEVVIGARDADAGREAALAEAGDLDVLVNNAGVLHDVSLIAPDSDFEEAMRVMLHGPWDLIRRVAPGMGERGHGRIVNMSSGWGSFAEGLEGPGAYGVAKAALNALTHALPRDLAAGVKVNAMCPGWVRTRMGGPNASLSPDEAADTAIWLATLPDDGPTGGFFRRRSPIAW